MKSRIIMVIRATAVAVLALGAVAASTPGQAAGCEDFLGETVYSCQVKAEGASTSFAECFRFHSATPAVSSKFDLVVDGLGETLGCSCKATGSFTNPNFDESKQFMCVAPNSAAVWSGSVAKSHKLKGVQAVFSDGRGFVFTCTEDPACTLPGVNFFAQGENAYTSR